MDSTKVNQQQKEQENKKKEQVSENLAGVRTFTPPRSGANPIPPQQPNLIHRMQALPENERPKMLQPNIIQRMQALPEDQRPEKLKPNLIQRIQRKKEEEQKLQMKKESIPPQLKKDEEEKGPHQMKFQAGPESNHLPPAQLKSDSATGGKMPEDVKTKMETSFGTDFSSVNIHSNSDKAPALNAQAFTQGNDIHFSPGKYDPDSQKGQELLGHELTHVVQQRLGKVQTTTQLKGTEINDAPDLEKEADEMGEKAAKGKAVEKTPSATNKSTPQLKELPPEEVDKYFENYRKFAQQQLDKWYAKSNPDKKLTGDLFANAAREIYNEKKDLSYVVPVEYALAQARLEGGVAGAERKAGNTFNIGAYDSGKSKLELGIDNLEAGFKAYYQVMANNYLANKSGDDLLKTANFTNTNGHAYATNPFYEIEIKGEIGLMHYTSTKFVLSAAVGEGKKNLPEDVKFIGSMLAKTGYLTESQAADTQAVCDAIKVFQKKEVAPVDQEWFKAREKNVLAAKDKESVEHKKASFTDGIVSPNGTTVGLLYFMTYLSGKIPSTNDSYTPPVVEEASETKDVKETTPAVKAVAYDAKPENYYTVQAGESLFVLSQKFGVPESRLSEVNSTKLKTWGAVSGFEAGEKIVVPGVNVPKTMERHKKRENPIPYNPNYKPSFTLEKEKYIPPYMPSGIPRSQHDNKATANLDQVAAKIFEAVDGMGTDEDMIFSQLAILNHNQAQIDQLKKVYASKYGESLEEALRGDLSGEDLEKALGYLNVKGEATNLATGKESVNIVTPKNGKDLVPYDKIPEEFKKEFKIGNTVGNKKTNANQTADVEKIQKLLLRIGYNVNPNGLVTGNNGLITLNSVFHFQMINGLGGDCVIGVEGVTIKKMVEWAYSYREYAKKDSKGQDILSDVIHSSRKGKISDVPTSLKANIEDGHLIGIDKSNYLLPPEFHNNGMRLKKALESIKEEIGHFRISCSYRSPEHNVLEAGSKATTSQHLYGIAADIQTPKGYSKNSLRTKILKLINENKIPEGGVGLYSWGVHYDIRGTAARWSQ